MTELEKLQSEYDQAYRDAEQSRKKLENYKLALINNDLGTDFKYNDLDTFSLNNKCYASPIGICVYVETVHYNQSKECLFCEELG